MNSFTLNPLSKSLVAAALLGLGAAVVAPKAHAAGSANANLAVSATVSANCTISTSAVAFGAYDPVVTNASTALTATGGVAIACTKGSAPNITLDLGQHSSSGNRFMLISGGGTDTLGYQLYQPPDNSVGTACSFSGTVWGTTGSQVFTPTSPSNKSSRSYNVCGSVAGGQDVSVGSYSDTVVATVNF